MAADDNANRPKRVRTGCLTCRERHLKCDEATPDCQNCRKSSRKCKRGVRLNFIDITTEDPPMLPKTRDWKVHFQDESRDIASEYAGGVKRYAPFLNRTTPPRTENSPDTPRTTAANLVQVSAPAVQHPPLPPILPLPTAHSSEPVSTYEDVKPQIHHRTASWGAYSQTHGTPTTTSTLSAEPALSPATPKDIGKNYLSNAEETLFMQVFVEEVGIWMDSLDPLKHFSRLLPFNSLNEPMLLNAFLACGARHLTLVNPAFNDDIALNYYDTATRLILASLQNQNRDTELCATTSIILNVYEIMSERPLQRMNHIAGARALLKECGWNANTGGVGGACFWLNVSMELLSCLRFNWAVAWDPDEWGVDMDLNKEVPIGREELWAHRMVYILARIANLRAAHVRFQQEAGQPEQIYMNAEVQKRYEEWRTLRQMCDTWNSRIPRTMHPLAYLHSYQTRTTSVFPEVWLVKRCAIVARLFYHTALVVLAQINPYIPREADEMRSLELSHAHQICGIVAHLKDRGVASVAIRSLAHAGECLTERKEQEEVLDIFTKIKKETGWRVNFVYKELKEKWGWESPEALPQPSSLLGSGSIHQRPPSAPQFGQVSQQAHHMQHQQQQQQEQQQRAQQHAIQQSIPRLPQLGGQVNPLYSTTNLGPYDPHYVSTPAPVERHYL